MGCFGWFEKLECKIFIRSGDAIGVAGTAYLAFEFFDLGFFEEPLVEVVSLDYHAVQILEEPILCLLFVTVVLGEDVEQLGVALGLRQKGDFL